MAEAMQAVDVRGEDAEGRLRSLSAPNFGLAIRRG